MKLRLGNFITGIVTLIIGCILLYFCYSIDKPSGIQSLSLIVTYPLYFVLYFSTLLFYIISKINLAFSCFSSSLVLRIMSMVMLIIVILLSFANIYSFSSFIGVDYVVG